MLTIPIHIANVGDWRDEVNPHCPAYNCPPDSTYNPCASRCQQTCQPSNGTYGDGCIDTCTEGCNCDPGYVEDTTSKVFKCIRIEECGCTDDNGNTYPANSHWLNDNCTKSFTCQNGTIDEVPNACSVDGYCVLDSGVMQCTCNSGYMGDGYNCTDIDECEDPQVCNQVYGWGTCTNTPEFTLLMTITPTLQLIATWILVEVDGLL
uniref:EGF-like domain-containing protein n=1 Tax=Acrobeloides nanus TaxID=290746 RepID=A0A914ENA2_9BILA